MIRVTYLRGKWVSFLAIGGTSYSLGKFYTLGEAYKGAIELRQQITWEF